MTIGNKLAVRERVFRPLARMLLISKFVRLNTFEPFYLEQAIELMLAFSVNIIE
ncbi:hypothetical protein D3C71_2152240 [compost metagenome]